MGQQPDLSVALAKVLLKVMRRLLMMPTAWPALRLGWT